MKSMLFTSLLIISIILISCSGTPQIVRSKIIKGAIPKDKYFAVVPVKLGNPDDLRLPDAIVTELLGAGIKVIDRTALSQMVNEKGLNLTEIVNGEEYFKIGKLTNVEYIVVITAKFGTAGVADATLKIIDLKQGNILYSATYYQPTPNRAEYVNFDNLIDTAKKLCEGIEELFK